MQRACAAHRCIRIEALRQLDGKGELLDVALAHGLRQVVHEHRAEHGAEGEDAVVVGVRLARALEALRVQQQQGQLAAVLLHGEGLTPQPHAPGLRGPLVAHAKALICVHER